MQWQWYNETTDSSASQLPLGEGCIIIYMTKLQQELITKRGSDSNSLGIIFLLKIAFLLNTKQKRAINATKIAQF